MKYILYLGILCISSLIVITILAIKELYKSIDSEFDDDLFNDESN